jgi:hypothetical protein
MSPRGTIPLEERELPRLYVELEAIGARVEGKRVPWRFGQPGPEELLVLAAQASRQDPRLLWVLVELLARHYDRFDPLKLRRALADARWPATLGVAFEFARLVVRSAELDDVASFVLAGVRPARNERYFLGTRSFAGALARRDAEESLAEYLRWGYMSREEPISKELGSPAHGTLARPQRMNMLRRLGERSGEFTLGDYLEALRGRASRRQATRDLATTPFLTRSGITRGARYSLRRTVPTGSRAGRIARP